MIRKIILLNLAIMITSWAFAQKRDACKYITYGIKGGLDVSTFSPFNPSENATGSPQPAYIMGWQAGVMLNIPFGCMFGLQSGLSLLRKGSQIVDTVSVVPSAVVRSTTLTPLYLQLPINLMTYIRVGPGNIFIGMGVYAAYVFSGKIKQTKVSDGFAVGGVANNFERDLQIGDTSSNKNNDILPFDYGLNILGGYRFDNGLVISGGNEMGLKNVHPNAKGSGNTAVRQNNLFYVSLGYFF